MLLDLFLLTVFLSFVVPQKVTDFTRGTMFEKCNSVMVDKVFFNVTCKCGDTPTELQPMDVRVGIPGYTVPKNIWSLEWVGCGDKTSFFISLYSGDFALSSARYLKIKNFGFLSFYRTVDVQNLDHPLQEIYIEDGYLFELPELTFYSMKDLKVMRFHNLGIRIINSRAFDTISSISTLQITKCSINEIRKDAFHKIGRIDYFLIRDTSINSLYSGSIVSNPWELTPQKVCKINDQTVKASPVWEFRRNNIEEIQRHGIAARGIGKLVFEENRVNHLYENGLAININNPSCTELSISIKKNNFINLETNALSALNTSFDGALPGVTRNFNFSGNVVENAKLNSILLPKDFVLVDGSYNFFPCHCMHGAHEWFVPLASKTSSFPIQDKEFYAALFYGGYCYADRQKSEVLWEKWIQYLETKSPMDTVFIKKLSDKEQANSCGYSVDDIVSPPTPSTTAPPKMTTFMPHTAASTNRTSQGIKFISDNILNVLSISISALTVWCKQI